MPKIRPTVPDDMDAILALATAIAFEPHELDQLRVMLQDYFGGDRSDQRFWLTDDDGGPVGVQCSVH